MPAEPVFFDANLLLAIVFNRPEHQLVRQLLHTHAGSVAISALTGHIVHYFAKNQYSIDAVRSLLTDYHIFPLERQDFTWAYTNRRGDDFEDALQLAVAIRNGCKQFHTFDKALHRAYVGLPVIDVRLVG